MFTTGQKVVCVDAKFPAWVYGLYDQLPTEGTVYVVRGLTIGATFNGDVPTQANRVEGEIAIYLIGITNPKSETAPFMERGFNAIRFRSLDEMKDKTTNKVAESEAVEANF
jgi:hypothetical protein